MATSTPKVKSEKSKGFMLTRIFRPDVSRPDVSRPDYPDIRRNG
jgi:hypothetical protein